MAESDYKKISDVIVRDGMLKLVMCKRCGNFVSDTDIHDKDHKKIDDALEALSILLGTVKE